MSKNEEVGLLDFLLESNVTSDAISPDIVLDYVMESLADIKNRENLPDEAFGLPKKRLYPLTSPDLINNAIKYFKFCRKEDRDELGKNIAKAVKNYHIVAAITAKNPIREYLPDATILPNKKHK